MIDFEKAYLIGLFIGGGTINKDTFFIELPYNKWGMDPHKMSTIATDILTRICEKFKNSYNVAVNYEIGNKRWLIKPIGENNLTNLINDFGRLGLPTQGELIKSVDLSIIKKTLNNFEAENLLTGIFDTRASLTESHRRFNDEAPVVSIEIPASTKNFKFVVQLCSWLTEFGSVTDQILYNHPCQHSPSDPYYMNWKKGFKIRFLVKSFIAKHSFAMQAKSFDLTSLKVKQKKEEQLPCIKRNLKHVSPVTVHQDISSNDLPLELRNKLFFHYHHICAAMGCPFAPIESVKNILSNYEELITFFPRLAKDDIVEISKKFKSLHKQYFSEFEIVNNSYSVKDIMNNFQYHLYSNLKQGLAYIFSDKLKGKRHLGSQSVIVKNCLNKNITVSSFKGCEGAPIQIINNRKNRGIIVSATQSDFNKTFVKNKITINNLSVTINE